MEWVETTGKTIEEAKERALDQLGVHESEMDYEVVNAPKKGLFGRLRGEARIRARVKPISRSKPGEERHRRRTRPSEGSRRRAESPQTGEGSRSSRGGRSRSRRRGRSRGDRPSKSTARTTEKTTEKSTEGKTVDEQMSVDEQAQLAAGFAQGLVEAFGADAEVTTTIEDDDNVLVEVTGDDLGLLVGQKGATLAAVEELVRTVVQRGTAGGSARIHVDVAGYRAKRRGALAEFVTKVATSVLETDADKALEAMSASDRKVVHDTIAEIDGVETVSEGEEPRRRVVIRRA